MNTKLSQIIIVAGLGLYCASAGDAVASGKEINLGPSTVADGRELTLADKGITIIPPKDWLIFREYPNTTLLLQAPTSDEGGFKRTIQVLTFNGAKYMDEMTAKKFEDFIVTKFSESSGAIQDFKMRNRLPVVLDNGVSGYLFYSEFKINNFPMMQMHVLASSAKRHFLLTYTDFEQYFDEKVDQERLNEAWRSIGSLQLDSSAPNRYLMPIIFLAMILMAGGYVLFKKLVLNRRLNRKYDSEMKRLELEAGDAYVPVSKYPESISPQKIGKVVVDEPAYTQAGEEELGDALDFDETEEDKAS